MEMQVEMHVGLYVKSCRQDWGTYFIKYTFSTVVVG